MGKKDQERSTARHMFVEQHKTLTEIAKALAVSNNTLTKWCDKDGWKAARDAKLNGFAQAKTDIKQVLADLAEQRMAISRMQADAAQKGDLDTLRDLNRQAAAISDEASKWNKNLQGVDGGSKVQLSAYLDIMNMIFEALRAFDSKLHLATLDFQEMHIREISKKLG